MSLQHTANTKHNTQNIQLNYHHMEVSYILVWIQVVVVVVVLQNTEEEHLADVEFQTRNECRRSREWRRWQRQSLESQSTNACHRCYTKHAVTMAIPHSVKIKRHLCTVNELHRMNVISESQLMNAQQLGHWGTLNQLISEQLPNTNQATTSLRMLPVL